MAMGCATAEYFSPLQKKFADPALKDGDRANSYAEEATGNDLGWYEGCSRSGTHRSSHERARGEAFMNFAISRILVPVDFSPHSELALRYATALASRLGASLDILHVVKEPITPRARGSEIPIPDLSELRTKLIAEAESQLEQYQAITEGSHVRTVTTVRMGQPAHTITAYAEAGAIYLIVMGTHGRSGLAHLLMGSVAERVVRQAACPVLTLREATMRDKAVLTFTTESGALRSALGHFGTSRE